eukprot:CAMPEP_0115007688 /NCGR_PEP_ID=MMETSP0216-20121206/21371_1 /TAXON_ID=223996 /ORGANISM="Protocruzia adherens, Strain Boccale" /LENGTH=453 /DNA_ID=CAMNT_0002374763 /DNA_START=130 /DNA_END=1491 /DNA_ORIENTATION=+
MTEMQEFVTQATQLTTTEGGRLPPRAGQLLEFLQHERAIVGEKLEKAEVELDSHRDQLSLLEYDNIKSDYDRFVAELKRVDNRISELVESINTGSSYQPDADKDDFTNAEFVQNTSVSYAGAERVTRFQRCGAQCAASMVKHIPPSFCWKRGGDAGIVPNACKAGLHKHHALCYEHCQAGYYFVWGGTCWAHCEGGYDDHGATCYKNIFSWYFKKSYIPKSYTFFSDKVQCPTGYYHSGALCYRDCHKLGLVNCGIGACALDSQACTAGIITMAADAAMAIAETILLVASFGASSAAGNLTTAGKTAVRKGIAEGAKASMKKGLHAMKKLFTSSAFRKKMLKKATDSAKYNLRWSFKNAIDMAVVTAICTQVGHAFFRQTQCRPEPSSDFNWADNDPTNISQTVRSCQKLDAGNGSPNDELDCAKNALTAIDTLDPTGLTGLAAAFIQPLCDV